MHRTAALLVTVLLVAPGCQMNERMSGAMFGGAGGAVIGGVAAGGVGVLLGGLAGGVAGYIAGDYIADRRERACCAPAQDPSCGCGPTAVAGVRERPGREASRAAVERGRRAWSATEARAAYAEALRLDPYNADAWNAMGLLEATAGRRGPAVAAFERALQVAPGDPAALAHLARVRGAPR